MSRSGPIMIRPVLIALVFLFGSPVLVRADVNTSMAQTGDPYGKITRAITRAKTTIDVALYSVNIEPELIQSLMEAAQDGVHVRLIIDKKNHKRRPEVTEALDASGIEVFIARRTQHQKFAIIDGKKLFVGSGNWTNSSTSREYEDNLMAFHRNKGAIRAFQAEWARLCQSAKPIGETKTLEFTEEQLSAYPTKGFEVIFTSLNKGTKTSVAGDRLFQGIQSAKRSIHIMMAFLAHEELTQEIIDIHKKHNTNESTEDDIDIRIVLDHFQYIDKTSTAPLLEKAGIPVHYKYYSLSHTPGRANALHHKVLVVDGKTLFTGSFNWSESAEHKNYENLIVVSEGNHPNVIEAFESEFERLFNLNRDSFKPFLKAVKAKPGDDHYKRYIPIFFDTDYFDRSMSLTRKEIRKISRALRGTGALNHFRKQSLSYFDIKLKKNVTDVDFIPEGFFLDPTPSGKGFIDEIGGASQD